MTVSGKENWHAWVQDRGFVPGVRDSDARILVADSWLVREGRVRGLERHVSRFQRSCLAEGVTRQTLEHFWQAVVGELPLSGSWFPRVELHRGGSLALWIRKAPALQSSILVLPWPYPDPRTMPRRKGPDLGRLAEVRAQAQALGADDALFTTEDGFVTESTTSSLLWWEEDELVFPDTPEHLLPGITRALIKQQALRSGIAVRRAKATPEELYGREVWLVNALHGIRPVAGWIGTAHPATQAKRAPRWRETLEEPAPHLSVHYDANRSHGNPAEHRPPAEDSGIISRF